MDNIITVGNKSDAELAKESLLIKRLRVACATAVKAQEDRRPRARRERPRHLSRIQHETFEEILGQYVRAEGSETFVREIEQEAEKVQSKQN